MLPLGMKHYRFPIILWPIATTLGYYWF
jgi:hypothetical protein